VYQPVNALCAHLIALTFCSIIQVKEHLMPRNYQKIQFISYQIYTGPILQKDLASVAGEYVGLADEEADIRARVAHTQKVIDEAYVHADATETVLKLFMMPEFYFRGPLGAYNMDMVTGGTLAGKTDLVTLLRDSVKDVRFKDWLFVFGTIIGTFGKLELWRNKDGSEIKTDTHNSIFNYCLVQKGAGDEPQSRVVAKEHMSGIDFLKDAVSGFKLNEVNHLHKAKDYNDKGHVIPTKSTPSGAGNEQKLPGITYGDRAIFQMEGITFGLEVCLDHGAGRLRKSPPRAFDPKVQIQLIPSCGMDINQANVVTKKGGYVFNCDGYLGLHTHLTKATTNAPNPTLIEFKPFLVVNAPKQTDNLFIEDPNELEPLRPPLLPQYDILAIDKFKPKILLYNAVDIPKVEDKDQYLPGMPLSKPAQLRVAIPREQPDNLGKCNICKATIGIRKRHHCRQCKTLVCGDCSAYETPLPHLGLTDPQRVCYLCYSALQQLNVGAWEQDKDHDNCQLCNRRFTRFTRKHHCRYCGQVICDSCTAPVEKTILLYGYTSRVRHCRNCLAKHAN
jgi:hypothetical protein